MKPGNHPAQKSRTAPHSSALMREEASAFRKFTEKASDSEIPDTRKQSQMQLFCISGGKSHTASISILLAISSTKSQFGRGPNLTGLCGGAKFSINFVGTHY